MLSKSNTTDTTTATHLNYYSSSSDEDDLEESEEEESEMQPERKLKAIIRTSSGKKKFKCTYPNCIKAFATSYTSN
jgi:hypothetical protein